MPRCWPLAVALCLAGAAEPPESDLPVQLKRFTDVFALVEREAADPVLPDKALYGGAIPGMLRQLDPHSVFFDPEQFEQLKELERSTRKGFGSVLSVLPGRVVVLQALPGTPSARAGIAPGDEILAVNGIRLDRLDLDQLVALLTESRQQQVSLDVRRPGNARLLQFVLTPEEMQAPSVERAFLLRPGVGYLRVGSFDAQAGAQVREAIEKLGGGKLRALLLDLRNNPGGILPAALETASLFLKPGQTLLTVRGRAVEARQEKVPQSSKPYEFPVAVLINGKSASASEIVTGTLQDHHRAVVLGEPSFGKGLVETVYPLSESTGLALTTAYYYTPSGRSIQRPLEAGQLRPASNTVRGGGIQPDCEVHAEPLSRLRTVLEASGAFTSFATEYTRSHSIPEDFEVTPALLDEFQGFLADRRIQPGVGEWSQERDWISNRLKTEIFNQSLGVEKGDEIEAQRDPVILAALRELGLL